LRTSKGPYIVVYGEKEEERDMPWCVRAESSNQLLHTVLLAAGALPDSLIPEDAFAFDSPSQQLIGPLPLPLTAQEAAVGPCQSAPSTLEKGTVLGGTDLAYKEPAECEILDPVRPTNTTSSSSSSDVDTHGLADGMTDEQLSEYLSLNFS
jgi:hypothetical protein